MIIDAHVHLPAEGWGKNPGPLSTVADAVAYLKAAGTDAALFNTWQGVMAESEGDLDRANAQALELARRYRGFLYPGAVIYPAFPEASRRWLARFRDEGFPWVGELILEKCACRYADPAFMDLFAECERHGHILQLHVHEDILAVARRFPSLKIVCSHIDAGLCPRLAAEPNVWLDISGACGGLWIGGIEGAYRAFGPKRLLYGSDFTAYEPRCFQERLKVAVPDPAEREAIFSGNVRRLVPLPGLADGSAAMGTVL